MMPTGAGRAVTANDTAAGAAGQSRRRICQPSA